MIKKLKYWFIRFLYRKDLYILITEEYYSPELGDNLISGLYNDHYEYVGKGYWLKLT